jgi:amino acid adenylation domain-containing protein
VLHRLASPWINQSTHPLDWNGPTDRPFTAWTDADLEVPVARLFERVAARHADRIAVDDGTVRLTYAELLSAARALGMRLARETAPEELIGVLLPTSVDFIVAMLGCLFAGRIFVPLDLHYPKAWIANVLADAKPGAVIADETQTDELLPPDIRWIAVRGIAEIHPLEQSGPDAPAVVLFTSGSTGRPKGIVNSQRALLRRVQQYVNAAHVNETDRFLPLSSECTIAGLRERITALLTGATLELVGVQQAGARGILDRLDGVTMIYAVPALLRTLMPLGPAPSSLRVVRVGGEAVLWSDVEALRTWLPKDCLIELGYSSTEAPIMQWFVPTTAHQADVRVPLGHPLHGNALAIVDASDKSVSPGETGELVVRSPYVALGHWKDGACSGDAFPPDPSDPSARILLTGDLVRLCDDGLIALVGRKDRQIKIRGQRVEPAELEAALRAELPVREAAVYPRAVGRSHWLIAYVEVAGEVECVLPRIKDSLRGKLPFALQPQRIHAIPAIPRLASGKLDMAALAALDAEYQLHEVSRVDPSEARLLGETEAIIATIWRRLFKRDAIDRNDDFFDLGGDSLMTINLMFEIEQTLSVSLPVTAIYDAPTIASLAAIVDGNAETYFSPLVKIKDGIGDPLFIVHGVGGNVMELFGVGRAISSGPVYGVQALGVDGRCPPLDSVADMASLYLEAIRDIYPIGPYHLAGYSSGGLIAFEMARKLDAGEVGSLTLIDSQTNERQWPLRAWLGLLLARARHHATVLRAMPMQDRLRHLARVVTSFAHHVLWRTAIGQTPHIPDAGPQSNPVLEAVFQATLRAVTRYRPRRYRGAVTLLLPEIADPYRADPRLIWRNRAAALSVHVVAGDHRSMIREGAEVSAILSSFRN